MANIEFGTAIPAVTKVPEYAQRAEKLGYDYLCAGEHMMFHGPVGNTLITLSVAAGATSKIKLMSSVVLLPLYNPTVLAKLTSVLDVASGGRYHMGIGIGGEFPKEFEACGIPVKQRASRSNARCSCTCVAGRTFLVRRSNALRAVSLRVRGSTEPRRWLAGSTRFCA